MRGKAKVFYLIFDVLFLLFVLGFLYIYCSSQGFSLLNQKVRKYWYSDMVKIIRGAPEIQWKLNKHFRQIILSRKTSPILTAQENQEFFKGWGRKFFNFQEGALQKILEHRKNMQQILNLENKPMVISFPEANRKKRLFMQDLEVKEIDNYLRCHFKNKSASLTIRLQPKPLSVLFEHVALKYKIPKGNSPITCQLSWATEKNRRYSRERSVVFNLNPSEQPNIIAIDFANYYQWLQEDDFTSLLLLFHQDPPGEIDLFSLTLSSSK